MKIEKNIPIPEPRIKHEASKDLMRKANIGDSIFLENVKHKNSLTQLFKKAGISITTRKEGKGYRIWKIK